MSDKTLNSKLLEELLRNYHESEKLSCYVPMKTIEYACLLTSSYFLLFLTLFSFTWIILFTFNPYFVKVINDGEVYPTADTPPDPIKCLMYTVLITAVVVFIVWLAMRDWKAVLFG